MTMQVETIPVLGDNYAYLVVCRQTGQAAAVDPADARAVDARIDELGVELVAIWNTHHHADHTMGNRELLRRRPGAAVLAHQHDENRVAGLTATLQHGDTVALGQLEARVYHTPGHTLGAICYHVGDALFTGDTLFSAGCGRLFEGDAPTLFASLHEGIKPLDPATRVFCGHEYTEKNLDFAWSVEPDSARLQQRMDEVRALRARGAPSVPSTLELELQTNPFLRCDSAAIVATLREQHGLDDSSPLAVFTQLRRLRDGF